MNMESSLRFWLATLSTPRADDDSWMNTHIVLIQFRKIVLHVFCTWPIGSECKQFVCNATEHKSHSHIGVGSFSLSRRGFFICSGWKTLAGGRPCSFRRSGQMKRVLDEREVTPSLLISGKFWNNVAIPLASSCMPAMNYY